MFFKTNQKMMNKDKLEKFIVDRRDAFDDKEPPKMAWGKIQQEIQKDNKVPRRISLWQFTRVAAAIAFLISIGIFIGRQSFINTDIVSVEENYPEFIEAKTYYEFEVNEKLAQLARYSYDNSLEEDMSQIDSFMEELKKELEVAPKGAEEKIINAMITNYRAKLDVLEKVLETAQSKNEINEKTKDDEVNI